jgi:Heterokaryon incompatibility protein (HET)
MTEYALSVVHGGTKRNAREFVQWMRRHKYMLVDDFWEVSDIYTVAQNEATRSTPPKLPPRPRRGTATPTPEDTFQYDNLHETRAEMRILQIHHPIRDDSDPLICSLTRHPLHTSQEYVALSYRWEILEARDAIVINNKQVRINQNLFDALHELRRRGYEYVWADQLCINQSNLPEKVRQINQMTTIYLRADKVIAWLGYADEELEGLEASFAKLRDFQQNFHPLSLRPDSSGLLFDLMRMWMEEAAVQPYLFSNYKRMAQWSPSLGRALSQFGTKLDDAEKIMRFKQAEFLTKLHKMLQWDYWRRAWILQELTVPPHIEVWLGPRKFDFELFFQILQELEAVFRRKGIRTISENHQHVANLARLRLKWQPGEPIHLIEALHEGLLSQAGVAHDKIYALLGICFNSSRFVTQLDYHQPMEALLIDMTKTSIQTTRSLDIICLTTLRTTKVLPSWAPDWRVIGLSPVNHRLVKYLIGKDECPKRYPSSNFWRASGSSRCDKLRILEGNLALVARGKSLGEIVNLSSAVNLDGTLESSQSGRDQEIRKGDWPGERIFQTLAMYKQKHHAHDADGNFSVLWRDETLKKLKDDLPAAHAWLTDNRDFKIFGVTLKKWSTGSHYYNTLDGFDNAVSLKISRAAETTSKFFARDALDLLEPVPKELQYSGRSTLLLESACRAIHDGRRMMETTLGWVGWAPPSANLSDWVYLLEGLSMPVILRPNTSSGGEGKYSVIGDAYVPGVMYGERWSLGGQQLEEVLLA